MGELIKIREASARFDITARTLRYYEDIGLIQSVRTDDYAYRCYDGAAIKRLEQIVVLRRLGIAIRDIQRIFQANDAATVLDVLGGKLREIDGEVALLMELRQVLLAIIAEIEKAAESAGNIKLLYDQASALEQKIISAKNSNVEKLMEITGKLERMPDVTIIRLPRTRMARSGNSDLDAFDRWWSPIDAQRGNLSPHDFMWYNSRLGCFEWLYAIPEGLADTNGYEVFEFPGGLYAVAYAFDEGEDINRVNRLMKKWVDENEFVELATPDNDPEERYDMGHIVTPKGVGRMVMKLFVPVVKV